VVLSRRKEGKRLVKITDRLATGAFSPLKTGIWYGIILAYLSQIGKVRIPIFSPKTRKYLNFRVLRRYWLAMPSNSVG
jgi:hypothetical protein